MAKFPFFKSKILILSNGVHHHISFVYKPNKRISRIQSSISLNILSESSTSECISRIYAQNPLAKRTWSMNRFYEGLQNI